MRRFSNFIALAFALAGTLVFPASSLAGAPQAADLAAVDMSSEQAMARAIRELIIQFAPEPLLEKSENWGHQTQVPNGIRWEGKGLRRKPVISRDERNDGTWKKYRVGARNLRDTLSVEVRNLARHDGGRTTFDLHVALDLRVHYHLMKWESGLKLYDGTADANVRVKARLQCEVVSRMEKRGGLLPEMVIRARVLQADVGYEKLEVTHIAGIGGDGAKLLGKLLEKAFLEFRPGLEEKLYARAEAAIVKAGDTREMRIGLSGISRKK